MVRSSKSLSADTFDDLQIHDCRQYFLQCDLFEISNVRSFFDPYELLLLHSADTGPGETDMPDKLRVGLIGANASYGWSPRAHLPALKALTDVELVAICTAHDKTARETANKYSVPEAYHDHRDMLRNASIDAVGVSLIVPKHHAITMDALEAGKHVYTEWPLGTNPAEAKQMADLAKLKGVRTMVGLQARCSPLFLTLKDLISNGYVGEVLSCQLTQFGSGVLSRTSDRTWQGDVKQGANTLTISFGHVIDSMCMCVGEFNNLSAVMDTRVRQWLETDTCQTVDVTSPDNVLVSGILENGALASVHVASIPHHGSEYRLEVYGRDGTLMVESHEHPQLNRTRLMGGTAFDTALHELPVDSQHRWVPNSVPEGPPFNVAQMWSRFATAIRTGEDLEPDFDHAVRRHHLLETIERAAATGARQTV